MSYMEKMFHRMADKLGNEDTWLAIGEGFLKIVAILIISSFLIRLGRLTIHNIFKVRPRTPLSISERREATLVKLLENILSYAIYFIAFVMILSTFHIDVKALLAGAGIVGLAVGFGAQSLVKDIITGFFIIFEDQFSVGDFIRVGQFEGTVEGIGLRTTKLKSWTGEVHIIPNGNIMEVTNFSLNNSRAVVDVSIAYEGDINKAEKVLTELMQSLPEKYEDLVSMPEILGIQNLAASEVVIRIAAETLPMKHLLMGRIIRKEVKQCLDAHGIEIPYPRLVMYTRDDQAGKKQKNIGI